MPKIAQTASLLLILTSCSFEVFAVDRSPTEVFARDVRPLLNKYCYRCHNQKKSAADLVLSKLNSDLVKGPNAETWHDVLDKLNLGKMPPQKEAQPSAAERQTIVRWLTTELARAAKARRSTGGQVVLRRLTRYEYANSMRDLIGVNLDFAGDLPPEPISVDGFRNNGSALGMSPLQLEFYLKTARSGLDKAIVTGKQPRVFVHRAVKSEPNRRRRNNAVAGNRLPPHGLFLTRLKEFPREGEFVIRVKAAARVPNGKSYPRLSVAVGVRADVRAPQKTVGEIDVDSPLDAPRTYTFRGRIEDFPLPGQNPKFPGMMITLKHESDQPPPKKKRRKRKNKKGKAKTKEAPKRDPNQPLIIVESVEFKGPVFDAWPPSTHTRILFPSKAPRVEADYAREVLARFMRRAYRRPIVKSEIDRMMSLFTKVRTRAPSFEVAIRDVLTVVLVSPDFLYLLEPPETAKAKSGRKPLTDHQFAARLSYFLWSTLPDERLSLLADQGKLRNPSVLEKQIRTMIADKRSWNFVKHFSSQWLDLAAVDRVAVNPEFYPRFDNRLKRDMRLETQHFFAEILGKDLSALNFLDSDFAMLNNRLAEHYGMVGPRGSKFERVALKPENRRGGLLTQGSILLANSTGEDSHPIRRAVWIRTRLLNDPPAPPPPDVPALKSDQPNLARLPLKRQLEVHRTSEACASCHRGIDPWGIPMENFDAVGRWRNKIMKPGPKRGRRKGRLTTSPVETKSRLPDGTQLDGIDDLKSHLFSAQRDRFARAIVTKLFSYALGRSPELSDRETIKRLEKLFATRQYKLSDLIVEIVKSQEFRSK